MIPPLRRTVNRESFLFTVSCQTVLNMVLTFGNRLTRFDRYFLRP